MDRVIFMTFRGTWTWDDYRVVANNMQVMIDTTNSRVDRIFDVLSNVLALPPAFAKTADELAARLDGRLMLTVVVGNDINREVLHALSARNALFRERFQFASTLDEARRLIAESRRSGPASPEGYFHNGSSH